MKKTILSLCDFSGNWPKYYRENSDEYDVIQFDIKHGREGNIRLTETYKRFKDMNIHGIIGAPICTVFAGSGARWIRTDEEMELGTAVVDACLRFVFVLKPKFWALENPVGKLNRYIGDPKMYFQPCDYGDPYTKKTGLWGEFNIPVKTPVEPTLGSKMHTMYGGKSEATKTARSMTPMGFAKAFYEANR